MGTWKKRKRARRRHIDKQRSRLEAIARGKLSSGLTPEIELMLTWARAKGYTTARTWYTQAFDGSVSQCYICGSQSSAPPRLRWMWILKHEQDHVIALGRENVAAFHALLQLQTDVVGNEVLKALRVGPEAFETVFGLERASKRW